MSVVAAIQMASGPNVHANLIEAGRLIERAVAAGAELVVLPENFAIMGMNDSDKVHVREEPGRGPIQDFLRAQAQRHGIWIVGGTLPMESNDPNRIRAACLVVNDRGEVVGRYDKIHRFDVEIVESGESYNESATIEAGESAVTVDTPFGCLGIAVCYDLRFPELFRRLLDQGMEILALPSAFTAVTGRAHWQPLVRARAIENLCYVIAPAQGGYHVNGRSTHGHSMIVDPWGVVLAERPHNTGVATAQLDHHVLRQTRKHFPAIHHRRLRCIWSEASATA